MYQSISLQMKVDTTEVIQPGKQEATQIGINLYN